MKIMKATRRYEAWLSKHISLIAADLDLKHQQMAASLFPFMRATFYRWARLWPDVCPDIKESPVVLSVGDLHVENFGTWRDAEGRLVWGINDLDEAYPLPYTFDLVRLATSAHLAIAAGHLKLGEKDACEAILTGYLEGLKAECQPFVLAEAHDWLQKAVSELRDPALYWKKMDDLPAVTETPPAGAIKALERLLPEADLSYRVAHRIAGLGSLGRQRWVALAKWRGGQVAREAKALAPSACAWAADLAHPPEILCQDILNRSVRAMDPFVKLQGRWIVRRLAPDCSRIELASLAPERDEARLLHAMGWETANIHLGSPKVIKAVRRDVQKRAANWLYDAAEQMVKATTSDWENWKTASD
jgi:hypothetical protein